MRQVADRLFVGDLTDCRRKPTGFSVVHACKYPCWHDRVGDALKGDPKFTADETENELWLNIIDPPTKLFQMATFDRFLAFMRKQWQAGRQVLIHCNKGQSRAPSLALVFMAKCMGALPAESFDEAWDAWKDTDYQPGKGIEDWLRENWDDIGAEPVAYIEGASPTEERAVVSPLERRMEAYRAELATMSTAELLEMVKASPFVHFSLFARITDKDGALTPMDESIQANLLQMRAFEAYEWCLDNDVPIRIVIGPKPRQSGGSRCAAELVMHHCQRFRVSGMVIGDENDRTDLLWAMFNNMVDDDRARGIWGTRHEYNSERAVFYYTDSDGEERTFDFLRDTANDPKAGASGNRSCLWFSEAGRYAKDGKSTDAQVISNASSSVPERPRTLIIMESTAEGSTGTFFQTVKGGVPLQDRMNGKVGNGWIKVSCWWHEVPDYVLPRTPLNEEWFAGKLTEAEQRGVDLYRWTAEQIAWRRKKMAGPGFDGNESLFNQEFPASEDEAFISSGSPRFSLTGITRLERQVQICIGATYGYIEGEKDKPVTYFPGGDDAWLWMREMPMYGAKYIVWADCMTGVQSAGSLKRDEHAAGVWRAPYIDANGQPHGAKLVAAIWSKMPIQWEEDIIAKRIHLLSRIYGEAVIAIEVNEALGIVRELVNAGANLWKRTKADEASGVVGATMKIPGWKTTHQTRGILVDEMSKFVRDENSTAEYGPLVHQLRVFVRNPDGTCAAKPSEHDDWVMGAGIGLACMNAATEYARPRKVLLRSTLDQPDNMGKGAGAVG